MRALLFLIICFWVSSLSFAREPEWECRLNPQVVGDCFTVHGRLSIWNGNPTMRIWKIGTKSMLGIREGTRLPKELEDVLGDFDTEIYADFQVCPMTRSKSGHMQIVCVQAAKNIHISKRR